MALLIRADGTREEIVGENEGELTYGQIRTLIGGGYIELVACNPEVAEEHDRYYLDEEGKLKGLPFNEEATKLSTYTMFSDRLMGDVLFVKREEDMK